MIDLNIIHYERAKWHQRIAAEMLKHEADHYLILDYVRFEQLANAPCQHMSPKDCGTRLGICGRCTQLEGLFCSAN